MTRSPLGLLGEADDPAHHPVPLPAPAAWLPHTPRFVGGGGVFRAAVLGRTARTPQGTDPAPADPVLGVAAQAALRDPRHCGPTQRLGTWMREKGIAAFETLSARTRESLVQVGVFTLSSDIENRATGDIEK